MNASTKLLLLQCAFAGVCVLVCAYQLGRYTAFRQTQKFLEKQWNNRSVK